MILFLRTKSNHTLQMTTQKKIFKFAAWILYETDRIYSRNCASPKLRKEKNTKNFKGLRPEYPLSDYTHKTKTFNFAKVNSILRAHWNTHIIIKNYTPYQHTTSNVKAHMVYPTTHDALNKSVKKKYMLKLFETVTCRDTSILKTFSLTLANMFKDIWRNIHISPLFQAEIFTCK